MWRSAHSSELNARLCGRRWAPRPFKARVGKSALDFCVQLTEMRQIMRSGRLGRVVIARNSFAGGQRWCRVRYERDCRVER